MGYYIYIAFYLHTGRSCEMAIQECVSVLQVLGAHVSHAVYYIANDINIYIIYIYSNYSI